MNRDFGRRTSARLLDHLTAKNWRRPDALCCERSAVFEKLTEEEREAFMDELLHKDQGPSAS